MNHPILTVVMNMILATCLTAQGLQPMTRTSNWLASNHATLGSNAPANWLMDLDADAMEIYTTPEHALVLVDRAPMITGDGIAYLRKGVHGLGGTHLSLVGEVVHVNDSLIHGVYSGLLGGTAVLMDQYVQLRNGVPAGIVRVITRVNGSAPCVTIDLEEFVTALFRVPETVIGPALTNF